MAVVRREPFVTRAPGLVCAVLSPVTQRVDRGRKADRYAHAGVKQRWLEDVDARHVEAFERVEARGQRMGAFTDEGARIRPFDAVPLGIRSLVEAREPLPTCPERLVPCSALTALRENSEKTQIVRKLGV